MGCSLPILKDSLWLIWGKLGWTGVLKLDLIWPLYALNHNCCLNLPCLNLSTFGEKNISSETANCQMFPTSSYLLPHSCPSLWAAHQVCLPQTSEPNFFFKVNIVLFLFFLIFFLATFSIWFIICLFVCLFTSQMLPVSPSQSHAPTPKSSHPGTLSLCPIRQILSHWGQTRQPLIGEQIQQSGYSFKESLCLSGWGTHMENKLHICYIYIRSLVLAQVCSLLVAPSLRALKDPGYLTLLVFLWSSYPLRGPTIFPPILKEELKSKQKQKK